MVIQSAAQITPTGRTLAKIGLVIRVRSMISPRCIFVATTTVWATLGDAS
jgi:hypothetical protein